MFSCNLQTNVSGTSTKGKYSILQVALYRQILQFMVDINFNFSDNYDVFSFNF